MPEDFGDRKNKSNRRGVSKAGEKEEEGSKA
jgi:hypothetical protein